MVVWLHCFEACGKAEVWREGMAEKTAHHLAGKEVERQRRSRDKILSSKALSSASLLPARPPLLPFSYELVRDEVSDFSVTLQWCHQLQTKPSTRAILGDTS
jgi:hypothetical protein